MPKDTSASDDDADNDALIRPIEAARLAGVHIRTLSRWEAEGHLTAQRTVAGHRRYRRGDILRIIAGATA